MNELTGAIEAGGTKFVLALARADSALLAETRIATRTPAECFPDIAAFFQQASAAHGPNRCVRGGELWPDRHRSGLRRLWNLHHHTKTGQSAPSPNPDVVARSSGVPIKAAFG